MAGIELCDGKSIENYGKPYFVAEVNSSHNGNVEVARQMIKAAAECGCDCVKFQSWSAESLYSSTYYRSNPIAKRFVNKFSLSPEQLADMAEYCRESDISFSSTPYSEKEVDFLVEKCKVPFIKIASMELNNIPFLKYIGMKGLPIVLSTGMGEIGEIDEAVGAIESTGNRNIVLLHCVSIYPTAPENIHLNNILTLRERYPMYPIGFSDHTIGYTVAIGSVAMGASLIEKHLTLDKNKIGMDNQMAMEPEELSKLVTECKIIQRAMGSKERVLMLGEIEQRNIMRRSVVSAKPIAQGSVIRVDDICFKRPGDGVPPNLSGKIVGHTAKKNIEFDTVIYEDDVD